VLLLCGGNIDTTIFGRCLERGLAAEGRLLRFNVTVSDRPGGVASLCKLLADTGVSIKDIMHERDWLKDIFQVEVSFSWVNINEKCLKLYFIQKVKVVCETRDWMHAEELRKLLLANYSYVVFSDTPKAISD
jgi:threonine dehydratase